MLFPRSVSVVVSWTYYRSISLTLVVEDFGIHVLKLIISSVLATYFRGSC